MTTLSRATKAIRHLSTGGPVFDRLRAELEDFDAEYADRIEAARVSDDSSIPWAVSAQRHLRNAQNALKDFELDSGFQSLLNAERDVIPCMTASERGVRVISLRKEAAEKLSGTWRGKTVAKLLDGEPEEISVEAVREALFHLNTHAQNNYRKLALLRRQLLLIGVILILLVIAAVLVPLFKLVPSAASDTAKLFTTAVFAGLLGGTLSAAISSTSVPARAKLPDVQRSIKICLRAPLSELRQLFQPFGCFKGNCYQLR